MPSAAFQVFRPHVDHAEPDLGFFHVRATDGGEAENTEEPETLNSLMITNFSAGAVLDLLAEFVRQGGGVVLPAGGPAMLAAETQRRHLPGELQGEPLVVLDARDIEEACTPTNHRAPWPPDSPAQPGWP